MGVQTGGNEVSEVDTSTEAVAEMSRKLRSQDPADLPWRMKVANMHDALASERDALRAKVEQAEARELALVDALITIRDKRKQCNRAVDCQAVARAALTEWEAAQ